MWLRHGNAYWVDGVTSLNPGAGQVLLETQPTEWGGLYHVQIMIAANTGMEAIFQKLDSVGAVIAQQYIPCTLSIMSPPLITLMLLEKDSLRLIADDAVAGRVDASFFIFSP